MSFFTMFALALAMSADAFSFSLGLGMTGVNRRQILLITLTVLLFHILMPLSGYAAGGFFGGFLGRWAGVLGAVILMLLGFRMTWEGLVNRSNDFSRFVLNSFYGLILLGITVSLDALSVGFTLGFQRASMGLAAVFIGVVAGAVTYIGLGFGRRLGGWLGHRAVTMGGIVLVFIGFDMLM